jgi:hypothetical protein
MKRRLTPFIIGAAIVLIGSLAYAADRKKHAKQLDQSTDRTHEEEALRAELLDADETKDKKSDDSANIAKVVSDTPSKKDQLKSKK